MFKFSSFVLVSVEVQPLQTFWGPTNHCKHVWQSVANLLGAHRPLQTFATFANWVNLFVGDSCLRCDQK